MTYMDAAVDLLLMTFIILSLGALFAAIMMFFFGPVKTNFQVFMEHELDHLRTLMLVHSDTRKIETEDDCEHEPTDDRYHLYKQRVQYILNTCKYCGESIKPSKWERENV